jgi:4-hydroxy-tetrahydrodipicolinate synthase
MKGATMDEQIHGIVPPMITPFRGDDTIDEEALRAEARYMIETARVHGLAVAGSTGEGHAMTTAEVRRVTQVVADEARGRVPVITGVITDSTASAIERGKAVRDLGATALQVTPVHYLFRPDDDAMVRHFEALARGTGLPIVIYNVVPWTYLSPQLLARILTSVEGVVGVKQSAGDLKLLADLLLLVGNRSRIMTAVDALLYPSFALGAHGAIAAILTAVPRLCVQLWDAVQAGDHKQALALHERLLPVWNAIAQDNLPANVKHCLALQGRPGGVPRPPMPETSRAQAAPIRQALINAGVL